MQKFHVFGKKLQKSHNSGYIIVASDLIEKILLRTEFKIELKLYFTWHHVETRIVTFAQISHSDGA